MNKCKMCDNRMDHDDLNNICEECQEEMNEIYDEAWNSPRADFYNVADVYSPDPSDPSTPW
jgi:hypothetical protein